MSAVNRTPEGKLDVVPTVSIKDGEVVIVRGGRYERLEDEDGSPLEPSFFVEQMLKQYTKVLVVDINGVEDNRPQMGLMSDIADLGEIWVDSGARYAEGIIDILVSGVSAVVLGTKSITGVDQLAAAFEMSENVYLSIDWDKQVMSHSDELKHMSPRSLADVAQNLGIKKLLFTDLSRTVAAGRRQKAEGDERLAAGSGQQAEGGGLQANKPLQVEIIRELAKGPLPLYVGGGIQESDLAQLSRMGAAGALLSVLSIITEAV